MLEAGALKNRMVGAQPAEATLLNVRAVAQQIGAGYWRIREAVRLGEIRADATARDGTPLFSQDRLAEIKKQLGA